MIDRKAEEELRYLASTFKAVAVVGPRQSGKTTLSKFTFPDKKYVSLENPDIRKFAMDDPRAFLSNYPDGAILDEIQRVPHLFSYLQEVLDNSNAKGMFILTGSNNFLLQENISQSLAGRIAYLTLLPLSLSEIGSLEESNDALLLKGGYPEIYQENIDPSKWFANYIRTYIERDVRLIKNITDLYSFERFLRLCAARTGQLLNMSSLAVEVGVDVKTIGSWLGILETSYIAFTLKPYHKNFNKRIVKMPKLYFYDTGLVFALLGIDRIEQVSLHPFRGAVFENLIIVELMKQRLNKGKRPNLFFWRDNTGNEIDVIIENGINLIPIEIKSGKTITNDYFKGLLFWNKITKEKGGIVIYGGNDAQKRSNGIEVLPISKMDDIIG
ncbi:ATP-binding protein [Parvicella tangerina]|uniref:ATP-binding protein n=1 Tax=Parvicella tangerina TaxID=2829795 RepID=A0A916NEY7_9FLAO|nr:ATP-binding protein [Parvicella tangerina]CAG5076441.1 hypothetical protein CRYO30217_00108 [Parvicella tangerina]